MARSSGRRIALLGPARARSFGPRWRVGLALLALLCLTLGACSDFEPEDLVAWRNGLVREVAGAIPGTDQPYPNLASVPTSVPGASPKAARVELQKKLEADNKATTYTPDKATAPEIPAAPAALPPGFVEAEQPVKLADAGASAEPSPPPLTPGKNTPGSGALGLPHRAAIVFFAEGSAAIDPRQVAKLKPLVEGVGRDGGSLEVVGHASQTGDGLDQTKLDNFNLSVERASAVAEALGRLGIKSGALVVRAEGDSAPVVATESVQGDAANRRVDIFYED
ncbi:MAG: OmpA family protein [Alphaproteobacteria bacterium]